jgi:hypothetical protein
MQLLISTDFRFIFCDDYVGKYEVYMFYQVFIWFAKFHVLI